MTASEAYGAFAYAYDRALGARFFKSVRKLLDQLLDRYPTSNKTHLDVACGTGLVLKHFQERGWRSTGVDASLDMLSHAQVTSVAADMRALPFRGTFARITCLYDSLNHLLEREELVAAFRSMRSVMNADSLLLFDMNHPDIYPEVWGMADPFVSTDADYHLSLATTFHPRNRIGKAMVTGWALVDGKKVKIREVHRQRAYSELEIASALAEADLVPVEVFDFDPYGEEIEARTVKLFFIVRAGKRARGMRPGCSSPELRNARQRAFTRPGVVQASSLPSGRGERKGRLEACTIRGPVSAAAG